MDDDHTKEDGHDDEDKHDEHNHGALDPHIWLNPVFAQLQVKNIANALSNSDPTNKNYYQSNAAIYNQELDLLDSKIRTELSGCKTDFITFHDAFSYFSEEYGLTQHTIISSIDSHGEVTPKTLENIISLARELNIKVIFAEESTSTKTSQVIADEIGGKVLVLSPLEIVSDETYVEKMTQNLEEFEGCVMLNAVEISNLTVKYPDVKALDDVSFVVKKGDFLGIIGPNGAGKSTLFDSMLGLNTTYTGTIKFFDQDIRKSKKYHKEIGYVPQKPEFEKNFPATVSDVVRMGLRNESDENKIDEILQQLWIHELRNRRIGELSGGQLQRVFIAKALVNNPKILILDEPVTGVDQQSIELFFSILRELNSKQGITIIWSSHDLDAVNKLANHVACLNRTLFFHGESEKFFSDDELVKQYSEASMQEHMHHH